MIDTRRRTRLPTVALLAVAAASVVIVIGLGRGAAGTPMPGSPGARKPASATDRVIWDYQEIVRREPHNADAGAVLGAAYLQKARESGDPTYYARAEAVLDAALGQDPQHVEALIGKGTLALARHSFREALAIGERAHAINPQVSRVYGVIADAQIELGMYPEAVETIQTMVDLRPDLGSYSRVAYARELHGDHDGAIEAMDLAVRAGGPTLENTEWTRVQLGNLLFAKGDLRGAERQYLRSLAALPDYVHALAGLARIRAAEGQTDEAVALYRKAIERVPLPEFVIGLGETLEAAGRVDEAAEQYELVRAIQRLLAANGVDADLELALFEADHGEDPRHALRMAREAYARRPASRRPTHWPGRSTGLAPTTRRAATRMKLCGSAHGTRCSSTTPG